jgi:hypothetical protein
LCSEYSEGVIYSNGMLQSSNSSTDSREFVNQQQKGIHTAPGLNLSGAKTRFKFFKDLSKVLLMDGSDLLIEDFPQE